MIPANSTKGIQAVSYGPRRTLQAGHLTKYNTGHQTCHNATQTHLLLDIPRRLKMDNMV